MIDKHFFVFLIGAIVIVVAVALLSGCKGNVGRMGQPLNLVSHDQYNQNA